MKSRNRALAFMNKAYRCCCCDSVITDDVCGECTRCRSEIKPVPSHGHMLMRSRFTLPLIDEPLRQMPTASLDRTLHQNGRLSTNPRRRVGLVRLFPTFSRVSPLARNTGADASPYELRSRCDEFSDQHGNPGIWRASHRLGDCSSALLTAW